MESTHEELTLSPKPTSSAIAIALRQRLNDTVDQLDSLQKKLAEFEVNNSRLERDLTIAKSDREPPLVLLPFHSKYSACVTLQSISSIRTNLIY